MKSSSNFFASLHFSHQRYYVLSGCISHFSIVVRGIIKYLIFRKKIVNYFSNAIYVAYFFLKSSLQICWQTILNLRSAHGKFLIFPSKLKGFEPPIEFLSARAIKSLNLTIIFQAIHLHVIVRSTSPFFYLNSKSAQL